MKVDKYTLLYRPPFQYSNNGLSIFRNLAGVTYQIPRKAYSHMATIFDDLYNTSQAAVIQGAAPFSLAIRNANYNLNANREELYRTPRSGSLPQVAGKEGEANNPTEEIDEGVSGPAVYFHQGLRTSEDKHFEHDLFSLMADRLTHRHLTPDAFLKFYDKEFKNFFYNDAPYPEPFPTDAQNYVLKELSMLTDHDFLRKPQLVRKDYRKVVTSPVFASFFYK